jgi:DNA-binding SARP family transcriptional activator/tetratricopeptide (TPR) repeat protein
VEKAELSSSPQIYLFGAFRIYQKGILRPLSGEKTQSLLAYLVLNPRLPHRREKLADLLYPDAPLERIQRNFSDTLYRLHKALGSEWLIIERDTVAINLDEHLWVDVWEFERLAVCDQEDKIQRAVDLYAGDLLPELYDDWLISERELRRNLYLSALEKLAAFQEERGDFRQALLTLRRLVLAEPLQETAHQSYLRLLGRLQRYGEALAHYEYLRKLLRSEVDAEPLAETRLIAETIENERHLATAWVEPEERTPFIGRKAERATLLATVEAMLKGQGGIIAIEGEAGIGKSRLLREVAASIRWRGATLLQGVVSQIPSASPFSPLAEALEPLIQSPRGVQLETLLKNETLAALAPLNPTWEARAALVELPPELDANRFRDALRTFGETVARLSPTVLALDDMQWADPTLWESMEVLAQGLARGGSLLILLYRRPEIEHTQGWEVIQAWDRLGGFKSISLHPLSVEEIAHLIEKTHPFDPVEVYSLSGGNPFYIHEWLAALEASKPTRYNPIATRLQRLSPAARLALEGASILGDNIPYRIWTEISELQPITLAGLSDELAAHNWIQPSSSGYAFTHDLIRSTVYDEIEPENRRRLHERAARAYQAFDPENLRARAYHLDRAGHDFEATQTYRLVARQDYDRYAFSEAQQALERALHLLPVGYNLERVETALELVALCDSTGDFERQATATKDALASVQGMANDELIFRTMLEAGRVESDMGEIEKAEEHLSSALALALKMGDRRREAEALYKTMVLTAHQGRWNEALVLAFQSLELARAEAWRELEEKVLLGIGIIKAELDTPAEAIPWMEQSVEVDRELGQDYEMWHSQLNLLHPYGAMGMWDRLLSLSSELIPNLEAAGAHARVDVVHVNQLNAYISLGDTAAARQIVREYPDLGAKNGARAVALVKKHLGWIEEVEGNYDAAKARYQDAIDFAQASQASDRVADAQFDLGILLVNLGNFLEAIPFLEAALAYYLEENISLKCLTSEAYLGLSMLEVGNYERAAEVANSGWIAFREGVPLGEQYKVWLWALSKLIVKLGWSDQANEVTRAAYSELQRQAQFIARSDQRRSFFEKVLANRQIVEAHDRLIGASHQTTVSLARRNAPLGRQLREDEYINVRWSVSAPEDEAIADKAERRQYRLKRLLRQAADQNAAPTDEDLAQALGVSRRTILRDMQSLAQEVPRPPTRKRKA